MDNKTIEKIDSKISLMLSDVENIIELKWGDDRYKAIIEIREINQNKLIQGKDHDIVYHKTYDYLLKLNEKWKIQKEKIKKEQKLTNLQTKAENKTNEIRKYIDSIENTLKHTLKIDDTVDWNVLKKKFDNSTPPPKESRYKEVDRKPFKEDIKYKPQIGFLGFILASIKEKRIKEKEEEFDRDYKAWLSKKTSIDTSNKSQREHYEKEVGIHEKKKADYYKKIDELKAAYDNCDVNAIEEYCEIVLNNSEYPDSFPKSFELSYTPENKILIIEYDLPSLEIMPQKKEVRFVKSKKELSDVILNESVKNKMFDSLLYQITLRTIHEIFEADVINAIEAVSFNGWVNSLDKSTGKKINSCVMSIQAKKDEFLEINLEHVGPKECFKKLKGIGSSKLSGLTPIRPILQINKEDKRFVDHYTVADGIDEETNLAAMDWEDFEHLVRELFEKEFSINGGEVKVTQGSSDGGVDAIAFDPDPVKGGKIVIQAKRYTNIVGVSAVRDLYGTVMNEGANKGILVTTTDYGPDAYKFANDKPITLLNGANLLHMLEKHGHKARIDIKEAKKMME